MTSGLVNMRDLRRGWSSIHTDYNIKINSSSLVASVVSDVKKKMTV